jgi:hypothetical protein
VITTRQVNLIVGDFGYRQGMNTLIMILLVVSAVMFLLAMANWASSRVNLVAAGLLCWVLTAILARL